MTTQIIASREHPARTQPVGTWPSAKARNQWSILEALLRGERLTVMTSLQKYNVFALSQECGRLRKLGWTIHSERIDLNSRKNVSQYWMG